MDANIRAWAKYLFIVIAAALGSISVLFFVVDQAIIRDVNKKSEAYWAEYEKKSGEAFFVRKHLVPCLINNPDAHIICVQATIAVASLASDDFSKRVGEEIKATFDLTSSDILNSHRAKYQLDYADWFK